MTVSRKAKKATIITGVVVVIAATAAGLTGIGRGCPSIQDAMVMSQNTFGPVKRIVERSRITGSGTTTSICITDYDTNGRMIAASEKMAGKFGKGESQTQYKYNLLGELRGIATKSTEGETSGIFSYCPITRRISSLVRTSIPGGLGGETITTLDSHGHRTESVFKRNNAVVSVSKFKTDENGRIILEQTFGPDGALTQSVERHYDKRGNETEAITRAADGASNFRIKRSYVFDSHGNWTKSTSTADSHLNGRMFTHIVDRTITYYK